MCVKSESAFPVLGGLCIRGFARKRTPSPPATSLVVIEETAIHGQTPAPMSTARSHIFGEYEVNYYEVNFISWEYLSCKTTLEFKRPSE